MSTENTHDNKPNINRLLSLMLGLPWIEILAEAWKIGRKLWNGMADEGMYEVLEYEASIELLDGKGDEAIYRKRQRVRYLQNNIIAFQDQIWGTGEAPVDYQCSPGVVVDQYRPVQTTIMLISLRQVRQKGDVDEFESQCRVLQCFQDKEGFWQTTIHHRTKEASVRIIFPKSRPPHQVWGIEELRKYRHKHLQQSLRQRTDGRWEVTWRIPHPRLNERYTLRWCW